MNVKELYREKLTSPSEAVSRIPDRSFVVFGNATAEPPALLQAVAHRAESRDLSHLRMSSLLPMEASAKTILSPTCADVIQWESLFVSAFDREKITRGEGLVTPAYFYPCEW